MSTGKMLSIASEVRLSGTKANSLHRYMYYCQQLQCSPLTSRTLFHWGGAEGPWPPHFLVEFIYDPLPFSWPVGSHSWNGRGEGPERLTRSRSRSAIWPRSLIHLQPWESFYTSQWLLSFQCEILERKREVSSCSGDRSGSGCISYDHASCAFYVSGLCAERETLHCINVRIVLTQFGYLSCNSRAASYACSCRNNKWSAFPC